MGDNEFLCYSESLSQPTEGEQYYVSSHKHSLLVWNEDLNNRRICSKVAGTTWMPITLGHISWLILELGRQLLVFYPDL
ncbi:hypothetical protein Pfo_025743 [Paulownia fortunei]|nr:hypothetical protein Pfo_025743 [Paulownia fortunei]